MLFPFYGGSIRSDFIFRYRWVRSMCFGNLIGIRSGKASFLDRYYILYYYNSYSFNNKLNNGCNSRIKERRAAD